MWWSQALAAAERAKRRETERQSHNLGAEQAIESAKAEGLPLLKADSSTGYLYVSLRKGRTLQYTAHSFIGRQTIIGNFHCAEQAALAVSRHLGLERCLELQRRQEKTLTFAAPPLSPEEALAEASRLGLYLAPADTLSGYRGVRIDPRCVNGRKFEAVVSLGIPDGRPGYRL